MCKSDVNMFLQLNYLLLVKKIFLNYIQLFISKL